MPHQYNSLNWIIQQSSSLFPGIKFTYLLPVTSLFGQAAYVLNKMNLLQSANFYRLGGKSIWEDLSQSYSRGVTKFCMSTNFMVDLLPIILVGLKFHNLDACIKRNRSVTVVGVGGGLEISLYKM
jgi:hypothetical protein